MSFKQKMSSKFGLIYFSQTNAIFSYFTLPFVAGFFLAEILGLQMPIYITNNIGLLSFLKLCNVNINTNAFILIIYMLCAIIYCYYMNQSLKANNKFQKLLHDTTKEKLLKTFLMLFFFDLVFVIIFIGPHNDALITPSRLIKLIVYCSNSKFMFSIFIGFLVYIGSMSLFAQSIFVREIFKRLKN